MLFITDSLGLFFIFLLLILLPINLFVSSFETRSSMFTLIVLTIYVLLILSFSVTSIVLFFASFELIVILLFLLLILYVHSYYRIRASFWFFIYSLLGSCLFVIALSLMYTSPDGLALFVLFTLFLIKIPMFPFNMWLPEVHAEASSSLSLLLAALLLKLGLFGLLRYCYLSLSFVIYSFSLLLLIVSLLSSSLLVFYYFRLFDFKKIIALSSILHLNFSLVSLFSLSSLSYIVLIINSLAHGFSSFLGFMMVGFISNRTYTRLIDSIYFLNSIARIMVFIFFLINISFPLTFNFIVEIVIVSILVTISYWLIVSFVSISFVSTLFYFVIFNRKLILSSTFVSLFSLYELILITLLIFISIFYGIYLLLSI
jgi:NADH:ubiquinone oxidoreductase subunit 4 (subunit M)